MTALDAALAYAGRGWPVFPVALIRRPNGKIHKQPLVKWGTDDTAAIAARDPVQLASLWRRAEFISARITGLIAIVTGLPTGKRSGVVILDIDVKDGRNGFDTLADLDVGLAMLPETPLAHTASGGVHVYFARTGREIRNTEGKYGLGLGLDIRGDGGFAVLPSPDGGYWWDPHCNLDTVALMPAPAWLEHRETAKPKAGTTTTASRFDPQRFLDDACDRIARARDGEKYRTYRIETFRVATLVRDNFLTEHDARHALEAVLAPLGQAADGNTAKVWKGYHSAFAEGLAAPSRRRPER